MSEVSQSPFFTVVIPTCARRDFLSLCLQRLAPEVQRSDKDYEVIVSDDRSSEETREWLKSEYSWAIYTNGPSRGPAANRNHGAAQGVGEWIVFIDDDCVPEPTLLNEYAAALASNRGQAYEGAILADGDLNRDWVECPVNETGGYFWSANIAVARSLFEELGGFDERYPYAALEDVDLHIRLKEATEIHFAEKAIVYHPVRELSLKQLMAKARRLTHSMSYHVSKHGETLQQKRIHQVILHQLEFNGRNLIKDILKGRIGWPIFWLYLLSFGLAELVYLVLFQVDKK